jgi:5-deoxy-D-glucuronate isomerase
MHALPPERQLDAEPIHLFAPGIYVRVLHMPTGSAIVSKIHKTEHFCLAVNGRATVRVGDHVEEVIGPRLMRTMPGTQRALYIHEAATWITFHPTDETDVAAIEQQIIAPTRDDPALLSLIEDIR